jgi:TolB protein
VFLVPPHGGTPRLLIATNIRTLDVDIIGTAMGDRPWSLDGRDLLVSLFDLEGRSGIYRVNRDDGLTERLTTPPPGSVDLSPTYSFDGRRIAFQRRTNGKGNLLAIPAAGGQEEILLDDEFDNTIPAWRPDGRHMLFVSDRRSQGGTDVWEMDLDGGELRQITFETNRVISLSVSSDDRIAYVPFWHDTFLFTVDVATGEHHQITSHTQDNYGARFAPDDRSILYHSTRTGNCEIWLHYLDGRPEMQITDFPSWDIYPDWSPDGERMIFTTDRDGPFFKLFIANRDGGSTRVLVDTPISLESQFAPVIGSLVCRWSPDGKQVAYMVEDEKTQALWAVDVADGGKKKLLDNITGFDWYRDAGHGIYSRYHGSESEMVAVNLETGEERSLFTGPFVEMDIAPDGHAVAFCHGRGHMAMGLAILELDPPTDASGLPTVSAPLRYVVPTTGTWHIHNGGWSADSRQIVYTRDMDYGDVFELVRK